MATQLPRRTHYDTARRTQFRAQPAGQAPGVVNRETRDLRAPAARDPLLAHVNTPPGATPGTALTAHAAGQIPPVMRSAQPLGRRERKPRILHLLGGIRPGLLLPPSQPQNPGHRGHCVNDVPQPTRHNNPLTRSCFRCLRATEASIIEAAARSARSCLGSPKKETAPICRNGLQRASHKFDLPFFGSGLHGLSPEFHKSGRISAPPQNRHHQPADRPGIKPSAIGEYIGLRSVT